MTDPNIGTTLIEKRSAPPTAQPVPVQPAPVQPTSARDAPMVRPVTGGSIAQPFLSAGPVDTFAITSAICGLVPIIPVVSQIAGVVIGIMAIRRIRRARQNGLATSGMGWAITGIVSSTVFLLASVLILVVLGSVFWLFAHTASTLDQIAVP